MVSTWGVSYAYTSLHVLFLTLRMNGLHDPVSQGLAVGNIQMNLSMRLTGPSSEITSDYFQKINGIQNPLKKKENRNYRTKTTYKIAMSLAAPW